MTKLFPWLMSEDERREIAQGKRPKRSYEYAPYNRPAEKHVRRRRKKQAQPDTQRTKEG